MKILRYILSFFTFFFLSDCSEDFVELSNPNQQTNISFWQTEKDAVLGTNAIYQTLHFDGGYRRLYNWVMDVRADDMRNSSPWWITAVSVYQVSPENPCYTAPWEHNYVGIWRANQVIDNIGKISMNEDLKNRLIGEAKFLRGLFYYHLVNVYKNVPLITSIPQSSDDYYQAQSDEQTVWEQVIKDLTEARDNLWTKGDPRFQTNDLGRATKASAAAYLAKVLMINRRFSEAAPILLDIINGTYGQYGLVANYRDNFTEANENNMESIFEVQFDRNAGGTNVDASWAGDPAANWTKTSGKARTYAPVPFGYGDVAPTLWIYDEFRKEKTTEGKNDPRMEASLFFDHPGDTTYTIYGERIPVSSLSYAVTLADANGVFIRKYLNDDTFSDETEWRSGINERIFRYSEVLLLYAECLNEMGQTEEAYAYIQQVRNRADLPDLAVVKPGMNKEEMRDQIAHERALEFCFEAQRYIDILRWGWFQDAEKLSVLKQHDPEIELWTEGREIMAIPPTEIDRNPNLRQNPGWTN